MKTSGGHRNFLEKAAEVFLQFVYPPKCMACRAFIPLAPEKQISVKDFPDSFSREMSPFLCPSCIHEFVPFSAPFCERCGTLFKSREGENRLCGQCLENPRNAYIGKARSVGAYDTVLMELIQVFKYKNKIQLAKPFGRLLEKAFRNHWNSMDVDVVLPVPLHRKRARHRGFNQSWLMISNWPTLMNNESNSILTTEDVLVRKRFTAPQTGLSRSQREENIKNAFEVIDPVLIGSKRVVLVDDVYTTGSTLNECARVLQNAGALRVDVLTLARAL